MFACQSSLEKECRRSTELQEMLSAAERRAEELNSATDRDSLIAELKSQLSEHQRRTTQLQALLDDETRKLSSDKVTEQVSSPVDGPAQRAASHVSSCS